MSSEEFALKELTDITLKATSSIEIQGRVFEEGEVIARFDKIQLSNFKEIVKRASARGGYDNRQLVVWEDTKELQLNFTQGIFSSQQFALLNNARLLKKKDYQCVLVPCHYIGESDEDGIIKVDKQNISKVFVYKADTFEKIRPIRVDEVNGLINIETPYCNVEVDFIYCYQKDAIMCAVGQKLIEGFLVLDGKSLVKDDVTGKVRTALLHIPKLKLISDLSMRLGRGASPVLAEFQAIGVPYGTRANSRVMELVFLDDDVDADIL